MKTSFLGLIGITFPRSDTRFTNLGAEVRDANEEMIGYFVSECFILRSEYSHFDKAKRALEENGVNHEVKSNVKDLYE